MTLNKRPPGNTGAEPRGDLRDPDVRQRFIFGEEPRNPKHRATLLEDFLFFGALLRR